MEPRLTGDRISSGFGTISVDDIWQCIISKLNPLLLTIYISYLVASCHQFIKIIGFVSIKIPRTRIT